MSKKVRGLTGFIVDDNLPLTLADTRNGLRDMSDLVDDNARLDIHECVWKALSGLTYKCPQDDRMVLGDTKLTGG